MKTKKFYFAIVIIFIVGCKPDLVVEDLSVTWGPDEKKATAVIANKGCADAGNFMVYFNAEENPESQNHRPQVSHNIESLAKGESITLEANFVELVHPDNFYLANVYMIKVLVDPKNMVDESDETNNEMEQAIQSEAVCIDFEPPLAAGTEYSNNTGYNPGDIAINAPNNMRMLLEDFWTGTNAFVEAKIVTPPVTFGSGQVLRSNNMNLKFDLVYLGFNATYVEFDYLDLGGTENFNINGHLTPIYIGDLSQIPATFGNITVTMNSSQVPGGKTGKVIMTGANIHYFTIGGQELWIDNVCVK